MLRGKPIKIDFFEVKPLTLEEMFDYGEEECRKLLSYFLFDVDDLDLGDRKELQDINKFLILSLIFRQDPTFANNILRGLKLFTGIEFFLQDGLLLYKENYIINEERWEKLKYVLSWQYGLKYEPQAFKYNPKGKRAKEMKKRIESTRQQVEKIKAKKREEITLIELISALCAKHPSINLFNVWKLTYYQFINQLQRLQIIDDYDFALRSILAGADPKKVDAKHWTIKI